MATGIGGTGCSVVLPKPAFVFWVCPIILLSLTSTDFRTSQLPAANDGEIDFCLSFAINNFALGTVG